MYKRQNQDGTPATEFPANPNGSPNSIAGICDPTGRVFGLMPHPEAFLSPYNSPTWTFDKAAGKLPREVRSESYDLEYGSDELQIHTDAIEPDDVVLIVDDLVATGGTAEAQAKLIKQFGASLVGMGFLMELAFLNPRQAIAKVTDADVFSLVQVR